MTFDAVSTTSGTGGKGGTWSHTTSGSNRLLVCGVIWDNDTQTISAVSYNSVAFSAVTGGNRTNGGRTITVYGLANPTTGANNVTVTFSGSTNYVIGCMSFTGAAAVGGGVTDAQTGGSLSATITVPTSPSNGMGVAFGFDALPDCANHTPGQTERFDICDGSSALAGYGETTTTTGSTAMTYTMSGGHYEGLVAAPITASGAAPAATRRQVVGIQ